MILYPAIDIKDGLCVRLLRGDMNAATVFNDDPADQARAFRDVGFRWLHLVDLNGAFEGRPVNADAVESILAAVDIRDGNDDLAVETARAEQRGIDQVRAVCRADDDDRRG